MADTGNLTELWLQTGDGFGEPNPTLLEVAELVDLPNLPSGTRGTYETTHMKTGPYKTFKKVPRKEGETETIVGNAVLGSGTETVIRDCEEYDGPVAYYIFAWDDGVKYRIAGTMLVLSFKITNPMEDRRMFELQVQWMDKPVITAVV